MKSAIGVLGLWLGTISVWLTSTLVKPGWTQTITSAADGIGTVVTVNGNRFDIGGGLLSNDGLNLFQSFDRFSLGQGQIANFLSTPSTQNILGRVVGGDVSVIDGLMQVTGSNANLYLLNPAGIIFGANARLNVPASFTATTANSVGFANGDFSWVGVKDYATLFGAPTSLGFAMAQPGAIVNSGNLAVPNQQTLTLIGGTVVSTGTLSAPDGQVTIATVPGSTQVRLSQVGGLLSLELQPLPGPLLPLTPLSLPQLLTGGNIIHATGLTLTPAGEVELTGSGLTIAPGDIAAKTVNSHAIRLTANQNLTLFESQLQTTGDAILQAAKMVRIRDSVATPFGAKVGRNLFIQGNQGIDILALNHALTPFQSAGALTLVSDGVISGDSFFATGGNVSVLNLAGRSARLVSTAATTISAGGDVSFGDYTGVALKVEAMGSILINGNVTITGPNGAVATADPDAAMLASGRSLILRAGLPALRNPAQIPINGSGSIFVPPPISLPGNLTIAGTIETSAQTQPGNGGSVILSAPGSITTGDINTLALFSAAPAGNGGDVTVNAGGRLQTGNINALSGNGFGGNLHLTSQAGAIVTGNLNSLSLANGGGGNVTLTATQGNLSTGTIAAYGNLTGVGGRISLDAGANGIVSTGNLATDNNTIAIQGAYRLNQDVVFTNQNNTNIDISFNGTVDGRHLLSLNAGNGMITLNGWVGRDIPLAGANWTASLYRLAGGYVTDGAQQLDRPIELIGDMFFGGSNATRWAFGSISAGSHRLTITADSIDFLGGANSVTGSGNLVLQPAIATQPIRLGGAANTPGTLSLTTSDFAALQDGFADLTIGRIDGGGTIDMASALTVLDALTLRSPQGNLNLSFPLMAQGQTSHLTFIGSTITTDSLSTVGGNITLQTSPTGRFANLGKISSQGGDITITGVYDFFNDLDSGGGNFNVNGNGQISAPIVLRTGGANLTFNGNVGNHGQAGNTLTLDLGSGNLQVAGSLAPSTIVTQAKHVTINGSVLNGFTQRSGTGTSTFRGTVSGLGLDVSNQNLIFEDTIDVAGAVNLIATRSIKTQDIQALGQTVHLTARDNLTVGGINTQGGTGTGNISLTGNEIDLVGGVGSVRGSGSLRLQPFDADQAIRVGAIKNTRGLDLTTTDWLALANGFSDVQVGRDNGSGNITIAPITLTDPTHFSTPTGKITLTGGLSLQGNASASFTSDQPPTTQLTTDISTADPLTFFGNIRLEENIQITATRNNNLTFAGTVNGAHQLTVNASKSQVFFQGEIGNKTPLQGLTITAQNTSFADQVTTRGDVTLNGTITFTNGAAIVARSGAITATGTLIGQNSPVSLTADDNITLADVFSDGGIALSSDAVITANHLRSPGQPIIVQARDQMTLGMVDSSSAVGNGGSVWLDPHGNIVVHSINTQGGANGVGGNVEIFTDRFFLASGTFVDRNGILASISTAGGAGGGAIMIRHGGSDAVAFHIGSPTDNGTAGAITSGTGTTLAPTQSYSQSVTRNNIRILTEDPPEPQKVAPKPVQTAIPFQATIPNTTLAATGIPLESPLSLPEKNFSKQFAQYLGDASVLQPMSAQSITQTLDDIARQTQTRPAIVYVFAQNDQLELVLFSPGMKPISRSLPVVNHETLMAVVKTFIREVSDPRKTRTTSYLASAQQLYRWMIAPISADLQSENIDTLLFAMDTGLRSIPIAALHDGQQFLVQKYRIAIIPSLSLTNTRYASLSNAQVLAMGASKFEDHPPLPAVPLELTTIAKHLWTGQKFLNQSFTLKNLKHQRQANPYQIIHLATHGEFQGGAFSNSYIQLWDSQLQLNQLRDLGWSHPPVELLVLSACQTAFGNEQAELGFAGIAFHSGVKSVLASLWYVSDEGTLGLMTEFYRQLKTSPIKAAALQQAQIAMLTGLIELEDGELRGPWQPKKMLLPAEFEHRNANLTHPFYWAAFTMIGSPW
jgi:filamentous hemagglutinin family protein